jgi:exodeoxyribonuclease V beta subunit
MARRLDEALQAYDEAAIHTIHGLCQRALADNAFSAGVPLAQELLADDGELRLQAAQDFWRRHVAPSVDASAAFDRRSSGRAAPHCWTCARNVATPRGLGRAAAPPPGAADRAGCCWPADAIDTPLDDGAALELAFAQAQALWVRER